MASAFVLDFAVKAMVLVLMLSLPALVVATAVGLLVSLFQALTQIQEQTLSFGLKLIAVVLTLVLTASWVGAELLQWSLLLFDQFPALVRAN
jgi:type III secretion HrpO family protein